MAKPEGFNVLVKVVGERMLIDPYTNQTLFKKRPHVASATQFVAQRVVDDGKRKADLTILGNKVPTWYTDVMFEKDYYVAAKAGDEELTKFLRAVKSGDFFKGKRPPQAFMEETQANPVDIFAPAEEESKAPPAPPAAPARGGRTTESA